MAAMSTSTLPATRRADGAGERYLRQLGRFVVAISRLESTSSGLCRAMSVDTAITGMRSALAEVGRRAGDGMPPWSAVRCDDLQRWVEIAGRMMDERDRLFVAIAEHRFTGSEGDAARVRGQDGTVYAADERYLERMLSRIARHEVIGGDLRVRLEYLDPKGRSYPLGGWHLDYQDPALVAEMAWYPVHVAHLPAEWRAWLERASRVPASRRRSAG